MITPHPLDSPSRRFVRIELGPVLEVGRETIDNNGHEALAAHRDRPSQRPRSAKRRQDDHERATSEILRDAIWPNQNASGLDGGECGEDPANMAGSGCRRQVVSSL